MNEWIADYSCVGWDLDRPWGGFCYIAPYQTEKFAKEYFPAIKMDSYENISPKILLIDPNSKLSWQYHLRRKELWSVLSGPVGVIRSNTDEQQPMIIYQTGDIISIECEERHRLIGLDNKGIVAELWCHTDPSNHSNENDIIRIDDDYNRVSN